MVGGGEQEITAAQLDPRFAILGGDLAYANALPTCYRVWDKWFDMWEENMITRDVRTHHTHHTHTQHALAFRLAHYLSRACGCVG
jgi:hypothetical protein